MGGQQGQGVESCGEILGRVLAQEGYSLFSQRLFSSRIKGGHTTIALRISLHPVQTIGERVDNLVALDQETVDFHGPEVRGHGVIIADSAFKPKWKRTSDKVLLALPITDIARKHGSLQMKNIVALGMSAALMGFPTDPFHRFIAQRFQKKGADIVEKNLLAFDEGMASAAEAMKDIPPMGHLGKPDSKNQMYLLGNEASALGAIAAGSRFMASYPITPASEIMEYMIHVMHEVHGTVVQTEDELSACMMAMGAAYAGVRGFTATSGPGFSLMSESVSMAEMAEIPVVIINVMRSGPSTGMPTKVEQSDILPAIYSGHGDKMKIVAAPCSIEDCFYLTQEAFNLAEEFQCPVIILSDLQFGLCKQSVPALDMNRIPIRRGKLVTGGLPPLDPSSYFDRFSDAEDGVSPRTVPGVKNGMFLSTGLEHNSYGKPAEDPAIRMTQMKKRLRKLQGVCEKIQPFTVRNQEKSNDLLVIGMASTNGAIEEAVNVLEKEGYRVNHLQLRLLEPFPEEALFPYVHQSARILIAEENAGAQLKQIFKSHFSCHDKFRSLLQYDGTPILASTVVKRAKEVLGQ